MQDFVLSRKSQKPLLSKTGLDAILLALCDSTKGCAVGPEYKCRRRQPDKGPGGAKAHVTGQEGRKGGIVYMREGRGKKIEGGKLIHRILRFSILCSFLLYCIPRYIFFLSCMISYSTHFFLGCEICHVLFLSILTRPAADNICSLCSVFACFENGWYPVGNSRVNLGHSSTLS